MLLATSQFQPALTVFLFALCQVKCVSFVKEKEELKEEVMKGRGGGGERGTGSRDELLPD